MTSSFYFSGLFRGVLGCNVEGSRGRLAWVNNWVTFMDCMLQMKIIGHDTRGLFVPTRIEKLAIDTGIHYKAISKMNQDVSKQSFEIRVYPSIGVIRYLLFHLLKLNKRHPKINMIFIGTQTRISWVMGTKGNDITVK